MLLQIWEDCAGKVVLLYKRTTSFVTHSLISVCPFHGWTRENNILTDLNNERCSQENIQWRETLNECQIRSLN